MSRTKPNALGSCVVRFFQGYLSTLRGMSAHTIRSYRDALVLYLRFAAEDQKRTIDRLDFEHVTADSISRFLSSLETERGNSIRTRNTRLAALHTFARFAIGEQPERMDELQRILSIPFKRSDRRGPVDYLEEAEVEAILALQPGASAMEQRDHALFALMFNTGARVQEILDLTIGDLRLDPPYQVRLHGKGDKIRCCPIWARTAEQLRILIGRLPATESSSPLFTNRRGDKLTRFGVRYLLRKRVEVCAVYLPSLNDKRIHPHSLRHTTAIHLLKAGVDFATVSQWLGHASLNSTMEYARTDIDTKRQALSQVFPDVLPGTRVGRDSGNQLNLIGWMKRL